MVCNGLKTLPKNFLLREVNFGAYPEKGIEHLKGATPSEHLLCWGLLCDPFSAH